MGEFKFEEFGAGGHEVGGLDFICALKEGREVNRAEGDLVALDELERHGLRK